jgi:hypothetical protein
VGRESGRIAWILRLVEIGAEGEGKSQDVKGMDRPGGPGHIAALDPVRNEAVVVTPLERRRTSLGKGAFALSCNGPFHRSDPRLYKRMIQQRMVSRCLSMISRIS